MVRRKQSEGYVENQYIEKQVLEDATITITDDENVYLGPELTLRRCRLEISTSWKWLHLLEPQILDCQLVIKKRIVNYTWCSATFRNTTFTGHFYSNDFGHWPEYESTYGNGSIAECDFSSSILDASRFIRTDMNTITLPKWPCFTILDPARRAVDILRFPWPAPLMCFAETLANELQIASAVVEFAPRIGKRYGCSQETIRESLERFGGVIM